MYHFRACRRRGFSQIFHGKSVYFSAQFNIAFSLIHSRIGSAIYNIINSIFRQECLHAGKVGYIKFLNIGKEIPVGRVGTRQVAHFVTQLSVSTCYKNG